MTGDGYDLMREIFARERKEAEHKEFLKRKKQETRILLESAELSPLEPSVESDNPIEPIASFEDMHPKERNTLLKIIAVMAKSRYGNDISKPHVLADEIAKDADLQGIDLKSKTIAEKLKEAKKLISDAN